MKKKFGVVSLIVAALALSASWAGASVNLQFNNNPNNIVGGSTQTIQAAPGASIVISLQLVSTTETTTSLDYWLTQFSGPGPGVFSITGRDFAGGDFPIPVWDNPVVITAGDRFSNSAIAAAGPDGVPDNLLGPQNGPDLAALCGATFNLAGTHQVATFTLTISLGALPGLYEIQTFDYPLFGWVDENFVDHVFDAHAAIRVQVVPELTTWLLLGLGIIVALGLNMSRLRTASRDRG